MQGHMRRRVTKHAQHMHASSTSKEPHQLPHVPVVDLPTSLPLLAGEMEIKVLED
jgi:hypothetical protein